MGLIVEYTAGQTPLDESELDGLLITSVSTRGELDEFEHYNIQQAIEWLYSRSFTAEQILSEEFICKIHKRMLGEVWAWAGKFRKTNKNIGIDKWQISMALRNLNDDALYWIQNEIYEPAEIAVRYKHRLVSIHCFANGNGRHSRLMADILMANVFKQEVFSWGMSNLSTSNEIRKSYIEALQAADKGDYRQLIEFAYL